MKTTLLVCFLALYTCLSNNICAQSDTILVGYSQNTVDNSNINEMVILPNNKIGFTLNTVSGFKAFITDDKGKVIYNCILDDANGYLINSSSFIFDDISRYVFIGNAWKDGLRYFISFSLDTNLQNISLIDKVPLEDSVRVFTDIMKYNSYKSIWEGFGYSRVVNGSATPYICYIGLDENYHFSTFTKLTGDYHKSPVLEFQWIESLKRYFVSRFSRGAMIVDEDYNVVKELGGTDLQYDYNGTHITQIFMYNCLEPIGSQLFCYAKELFDWPYNAAFATIDLNGDSTNLVEAIPLSDPPLGMNYASQMRVDLDGNFVISGINAFNPPDPNKISVAKFSPSYDKIWEFSYQSDIAFAIWDMEIDQNNDIILVGQSWNIFGDDAIHGFLLKVYSNGKLSSTNEIPFELGDKYNVLIGPNPVNSSLYMYSKSEIKSLQIWSLSGKLMFERDLAITGGEVKDYRVDLPNSILPGLYVVDLLFDDGKQVVKKVVVERQ